MKRKANQSYQIGLAAFMLIMSGTIFTLQRWYELPLALHALAIIWLFIGVLWVLQPRQPYILAYQSRSFASQVIKWISAPQIEAGVLFWFGMSFLLQPEQIGIYRLTGSVPLSILMGWGFLWLGYGLIINAPTPKEYTLIAGIRLVYTVLVVVDVLSNGDPIIVIGVYVGGILHGVVSIALHWHLAELAREVLSLKHDIANLERGSSKNR